MSRQRKILIALAASAALLLLFIILVLPGIVKTKAVEGIKKSTGRQAAIDRVSINPFTLSARIDGFRMKEADGAAVFASFSSLKVRVSTASIIRRAPVVGELTLVRPQLSLVRVSDNNYNFSDIVERIRKQPKSEGETLFSLNNIRIDNGSIDFDDRAARQPASHTLRSLTLAIPFISNIPYLADKYVTPHFGAIINGAPLRLDGKLKPLTKSAETVLTLKLDKLNLPHYLAYLPFDPGFAMPSGTLSTDLELAYRIGAKEKPELNIAGKLDLAGLAFTERQGTPLLALNQASAKINRLAAFSKQADIGRIQLDGLEAHISRDRQGSWNFSHLFTGASTVKPAPPATEKAKEHKPSPMPVVTLSGFALTNSTLHLRDAQPPGGFATTLQNISIEVRDFSTAPQKTAQWQLACDTDAKEQLSVNGTFSAAPVKAEAKLKLVAVQLKRYYPYLSGLLTAPIAGSAGLESVLTYSDESGLKVSDTTLSVSDLLVPFGPTDKLALKSLTVAGTGIDLKERQADIATVTLQRGSVSVSKESDGTLSPRQLLRKPAAAQNIPAPAGNAKPVEKPFRYTVRDVAIKGVDASFTDHGYQPAPTFTLKGISAGAKNITGPTFGPIPFTLTAGFGSTKAKIAASGTAIPEPFRLKGLVSLSQIPLRDFDPYYPDDMGIFIAGGTVDTRLNLDLAQKGDKITGNYSGSLGVRSFYSLDTIESEELLKWESLQIDNIRGTLQPFSLAIKDIALTSPFARVIVNKDGTLNLQQIGKVPKGEVAPQVATPAPQPAVPATTAPPVAIDTITIQDGTLAFIDRKLPGGFASTFFNLGGRVSGLSSESSRFATVDLRGVLENRSPLKISGTLNPLRGDLFMDLTAAFTDIELSPVTPYSGTYLGYSIDKGKLFLDLKYKIENKALSAENKVFIDQFTFGRKIESDKATNLPVRLAVALLKDGKGEIHLDLPVSGRTDDPKFSVWKVAFQMLKNLLVKAATSPFSLLSSMFGSSEDFSSVSFAPGSAAVSANEQEKLVKLAKALKDRPAVSLEISGYLDRQRDPEGYRQLQLTHRIHNEKFLAMVKSKQNRPEDSPETVSVTPAEYSVYLKAVYRKEDFPKPRNAIGMLKDLPDDEMKKLILTHLPAGDKELQALARERAVAVQSFLRDKGGMPRERLFLKQDDPFKPAEKKEQSPSRVEFGVTVK
ncbi:DUF748 domain-containing protein [Geobacter pelophilus]|uniref:DUF748 domain-containing protein n=1 Tax=Geoanaerobacter pelophilus TaxID=60036 RepID=A0AAW4L5R7_9BACT|nr:DUF748 domain-containing protein [Geoanaerobacter pelophilus]MBT0666318.1 DUF748 domain-containing protein [Geoanaerobacter pelophilus]